MKASGVEISGLGAPFFTTTAMPEFAKTASLPVLALLSSVRASRLCLVKTITSAVSPACTRLTRIAAVAQVISSLLPVAYSNLSRQFFESRLHANGAEDFDFGSCHRARLRIKKTAIAARRLIVLLMTFPLL